MNLNQLHNEMNQEFMGHKIDGIIIQPPMTWDSEDEILMAQAWRDMALENLHNAALECKLFWENKDAS